MADDVMKTTRQEIKARIAVRKSASAYLRDALTPEERHALGVGAEADSLFGALVEVLRVEARARMTKSAISAERRSPLIAERYASTLARGIVRLLHLGTLPIPADLPLEGGAPKPWASVTKDVLHTAYMLGGVPALNTHDAHPGSRAGVFIVDLRDLSLFTTRDGKSVTSASVAARVAGKSKP
jgi:hypothetical protein